MATQEDATPPDAATSVGQLVAAAAARFGDDPFLLPVDGDAHPVTFNDVATFTQGCAEFLDARGAPEGARVTIVLHNSPLAALLTVGVLAANRVLVPLNPKSGKEELDGIIEQAKPVVILGDPTVEPKLGEHPGWLSVDGEQALFEEMMALGSGPGPGGGIGDPDRDAEIVYTSGSTGVPKGVVMSQRSLVSLALSLGRWAGATADDVFLNVVPIFHTGGQVFPTLTPLSCGAKSVCVRSEVALVRFWKLVESFDPTWTLVVNAYLGYLVEQPDNPTSCRLRGVLAGGSPLSPALRDRFSERFGLDVFQVYGLTEMASIATVEARERPAGAARGVGRPIDCVRVRIIDQEGNDVPTGVTGEVLLAGDSQFDRYLDDPELTERVLKDGWLHTGDVGNLDERGELSIQDRLDNMLIVGGENVYPAEVDKLVPRLEGVSDGVLVGLPDPVMGVELALVYKLQSGATAQPERWRRQMAGSLSSFKIPRKFIPLEEIGFEEFPLSPIGKILRTEVQSAVDVR